MSSTNKMRPIRFQLAIDHNRDKKIAKDEQISNVDELRAYDKNGDQFLTGNELTDVYVKYDDDLWLQGNRTYKFPGEKMTTITRLSQVGLNPPNVKLDTKFKRNRRVRIIGLD